MAHTTIRRRGDGGDTMRTRIKRSVSMAGLVVAIMLSACADTRGPASSIPTARDTPTAPNSVGRYKVGKPYQIKGTWYQPVEDFGYEEVGMASWYGRQFHGRHTANGETYNMNDMTAAHRTLPLPSVVRVTNLNNGRSVKLRVNDRGPFAKGRIIDVSRRAAQELGFKNKGVTRVRVEIVADESRALAGRGGSGGRMSNSVAVVGLMPDPAVAALNRQQLASAKTIRPTPTRRVIRAPVSAAPTARSTVVGPVPARTGTRTYIQAGSFSDPNNAHRVRSRLSGLGPVEVRELQIAGRGYYRVRVGPLPSDRHAEQVLADVIRAGYPTSRIVSE